MVIDLMRQFYDEERVFRITGEQGQSVFVQFSGAALRPVPAASVGGVELGSREPVFDITISAAKKSTFSRLSQNETAKECYQLGFFNPANADAALAALEMMDFEGIEKVRQRVRQNASDGPAAAGPPDPDHADGQGPQPPKGSGAEGRRPEDDRPENPGPGEPGAPGPQP